MNNYDQSSTGISLEFDLERDICTSLDRFGDNFERLLDDTFLFIDYGNFSKDFDLADSNNYKFTKAELICALKAWDGDIQALRQGFISFNGSSIHKATKSELIEYAHYRIYNSSCIAEFYIENFTQKFDTIEIRGYSQSDYAKIIFTHKDMKKYSYNDETKFLNMMQRYFTNLFHDAPIYCLLTIDGKEIRVDHELENEYEYNEDEIKAIIKDEIVDYSEKEQEIIMNFVEEHLKEV